MKSGLSVIHNVKVPAPGLPEFIRILNFAQIPWKHSEAFETFGTAEITKYRHAAMIQRDLTNLLQRHMPSRQSSQVPEFDVLQTTYWFDVFQNATRIKKVTSDPQFQCLNRLNLIE